ncbi:hypothetical protein PQ478_19440 [Alkalihalophilus pseudofirmus]|uniref:hypothetical protein n=1 Tax=Alkalihalophilus pseudofirmus TaxID=79885 RepID=UPI00259BB17A|nr:hypothetical protein [Alkalihalophilus pseudofirmus]WEG16653.1 hypothetical protein PQ478_19440 [Alkalihalophilus pseudofirmus]
MKHKLLYGILTLIIILLGVLLVNSYSQSKQLEERMETMEEHHLFNIYFMYHHSLAGLISQLESGADTEDLSYFFQFTNFLTTTSSELLREEELDIRTNLQRIDQDLQENDTTEKREALYELVDQFQLNINEAIFSEGIKSEQLEEAMNEFNQELVEYQRVHRLGD